MIAEYSNDVNQGRLKNDVNEWMIEDDVNQGRLKKYRIGKSQCSLSRSRLEKALSAVS